MCSIANIIIDIKTCVKFVMYTFWTIEFLKDRKRWLAQQVGRLRKDCLGRTRVITQASSVPDGPIDDDKKERRKEGKERRKGRLHTRAGPLVLWRWQRWQSLLRRIPWSPRRTLRGMGLRTKWPRCWRCHRILRLGRCRRIWCCWPRGAQSFLRSLWIFFLGVSEVLKLFF